MKLDKNVLERIKKINWFENCGSQVNNQIEIPIIYIHSWKDAKTNYKLLHWENTTLEARNELTSFLHGNYRNQYSNWNKLVDECYDFLDIEVIPKINKIKEENNLDQRFINSVKWHILNAIMEATYKNYVHRLPKNLLYLNLLSIYESGNFPCGWKSKWPNGYLIVY